jgi:hypothetical protein
MVLILLVLLQPAEGAMTVTVSLTNSTVYAVTSYSLQIQGISSWTGGDTIKFSVPTGITVSGVNDGETASCSLQVLHSISNLETSTVTTCTYNANDSGNRTFTFTTAKSYSSVSFMSLTTGAYLQNPDSVRFLSNKFSITAGSETNTTQNTITYTADALASASVSNAVESAGSPTTMTFTFRITNPIPQNGKIQIICPDQVTFEQNDADGLVGVTVYGETKSGFATTVSGSTPRSFTITGLFSTAGISADAQDIVVMIDQLKNPESQVASDSFTISTMDSSSYEIDKQSTGLTVSSTEPGVITLTSITPSSYSADAEITVQFLETTDINPSNAFIQVYWPTEVSYNSSGTQTCSVPITIAVTEVCTVDTTNNFVKVDPYTLTTHLYILGPFVNPLGAVTTSTWQLIVYDNSNNLIMQKTDSITYTTTSNAVTVDSATRPSDTTTVAKTANYTVTFTTATRMLSDSTIQLTFPIDQVKKDGSTSCFGTAALVCTLTDVNATHFQTEITQWCNAGAECAAGSSITFILVDAINPSWVVDPLTSSVQIKTINNQLSGAIIDEITSGVTFSPSLTPGTLVDIEVNKDTSTNKVGEQTSYQINFTVVTDVPSGGQVKLTFPSNAVYKASGTEVVCTNASSTAETCSSTADGNNMISEILISSACSSGCTTGTVLTYNLTEVYNPGSTKPIDTSFQANTQTTEGYLIDSGTSATNNDFSLIANTFDSISVDSPSGTVVVGAITEYKFTIGLKNAIPSSGGKLTITFPTEIVVQSTGSCTAVISSTSHTCTHSSIDNTATVTFSSDAAVGSSLVVTLTNAVKNPTVGQQSSYITYASTVTESTTTYDIDQDLASITVTPNTYGTLTSTSVTRVDSSLINDATNINIKATSANPIIANSIITFHLPFDQVQYVTDINGLTFFQLDSSDVVGSALATTSISATTDYVIFSIKEWCSDGTNPCAADAENIKLRVTGLQNPGSTLPPSNSCKIYVDTNDSPSLLIDSKDASLFATPSIQAGPLENVVISRDINQTGAEVTYTVQFDTTNSLTETGGIFLSFTPPSGFMYQNSSALAATFEGSDASTGTVVTTTTVTYGEEVSVIKIPMG